MRLLRIRVARRSTRNDKRKQRIEEKRIKREDILKLSGLFIFSVAMGYMESAVVVYLRELYYPSGFHILSQESLKAIPMNILMTEVGREVSTVVILTSISILIVSKNWLHRFGYFLFAFAIWDITYYLWLYVLIDWPESLLTNDVLFLIPAVWLGPIIAPVIISLSFIALSIMLLSSKKDIVTLKEFLTMWRYWVYLLVAMWVMASAFILWEHRIFYMWNNIIVGLIIVFFTVIIALRKK
jgi:hypothetical protein